MTQGSLCGPEGASGFEKYDVMLHYLAFKLGLPNVLHHALRVKYACCVLQVMQALLESGSIVPISSAIAPVRLKALNPFDWRRDFVWQGVAVAHEEGEFLNVQCNLSAQRIFRR